MRKTLLTRSALMPLLGGHHLAAAYANLRRFDEAIAALKKLLELNPDAADAKAMLQDIERAKGRR